MHVQIILGNDNNYYFLVDGQLANKLSKQDLQIVNAKPLSGTMELFRKSKLKQDFPIAVIKTNYGAGEQDNNTYFPKKPNHTEEGLPIITPEFVKQIVKKFANLYEENQEELEKIININKLK
jgi:hypothetical protein